MKTEKGKKTNFVNIPEFYESGFPQMDNLNEFQ
jgi:hypothetical protein